MYKILLNGWILTPFSGFSSYEEARKRLRKLITVMRGKYQDSYSNLGFKIVKFS